MKKKCISVICAVALASSAQAGQRVQLRQWNQDATPRERPLRPQEAAPDVSELAIYAMASTTAGGGWEYPAGSMSTTYNYGGKFFRVAVVEMGYASWRKASYKGNYLPFSANYQEDTIRGGTATAPESCSAGQTVIGYIEYWKLDGETGGGKFYYETSGGTGASGVSTQIYIKLYDAGRNMVTASTFIKKPADTCVTCLKRRK